MTTTLVTGGAGFIGSYVTKKLLARGHEVAILDAFAQYSSPFTSNYQAYLKARFEGVDLDALNVIRGNSHHPIATRRLLEDLEPDHVVHMAALPIATMSNYQAEEATDSIFKGTVNLLEATRDLDCVERFTYISSSMVYGDFAKVPASEADPKNPKGVYGATKLAGEIMTEAYGREFGIEYSIVRPSAVYGPTDTNRRVSQIFVENALRGRPLTLNGPDARLDFSYVDDTAEGIVLAALEPDGANETFNITAGKAHSLREFAHALKNIVPDVQIIEEADDNTRPVRGTLDITKARERLGYKPRYDLETGLRAYVEFVRKYIRTAVP